MFKTNGCPTKDFGHDEIKFYVSLLMALLVCYYFGRRHRKVIHFEEAGRSGKYNLHFFTHIDAEIRRRIAPIHEKLEITETVYQRAKLFVSRLRIVFFQGRALCLLLPP